MVASNYSIYDKEDDDADGFILTDTPPPLVPVERVLMDTHGTILVVTDAVSSPSNVEHRDYHHNNHEINHRVNVEDSTPTNHQGNHPIGNSNDDDSDNTNNQVAVASGVATGTLGFLFCGPLVGLIVGFGATYVAEQKPQGDAIGDTARAIGDVALVAAEKARILNEQHHIMDQFKLFVHKSVQKVKQIDQKYHIMERTGRAAVCTYKVTARYVQKHKLIDRSLEALGQCVGWIAEKVNSKLSESSIPSNVIHPQTASHTARERASSPVPIPVPSPQPTAPPMEYDDTLYFRCS